jgi:leucyl/phenylalanyl-tRNA--protein transferase
MNIPQLNKYDLTFPHAMQANKDGIVAWGGDLNPSRLIKAYQNGIFPWYNENDPIIWWSPETRLIMELNDFKLSRSLKKSMKKFTYKFDTNFQEVIKKCASTKRQHQSGTWLNSEMIEAYTTLHDMGYAHSVESYLDGRLVGGLYGVSIGGVFCGESMFLEVSDASKAAYATLVQYLKKWGYEFIDCQVPTQHLKSLGAKEVTRKYFLDKLKKSTAKQITNIWKVNSYT